MFTTIIGGGGSRRSYPGCRTDSRRSRDNGRPRSFGSPSLSDPRRAVGPMRRLLVRRDHLPGDLVSAGLWTLAVVPSALGFWLVAGSLAGVTPGQVHVLIVGSLL